MNRRDFIKYLLSTPIAAKLDVEKLLWVPEKTIFIPHPAQKAFYEGIPYHEINASAGIWLGLARGNIYPEVRKLIKLMEEDKKK